MQVPNQPDEGEADPRRKKGLFGHLGGGGQMSPLGLVGGALGLPQSIGALASPILKALKVIK